MKLYIEYYSPNILKCGNGLCTILKETAKTFVCENDISKERFTLKKDELNEINNVYDSLRFIAIADNKDEGKEKSKIAFKKYFEKYNLI